MTIGTLVRGLSAVGVVAGLSTAANNAISISSGLFMAAISFTIFATAVLMKIESS